MDSRLSIVVIPWVSERTLRCFNWIFFSFSAVRNLWLIPWRCELIAGMLGVDLLGFHTFDAVSHFLDTSVRLLPVACSAKELSVDGRIVVAESFPMGIHNEKYASLTSQHNVIREVDKLQEADKGRRMILAIDRLDYSKDTCNGFRRLIDYCNCFLNTLEM